MSDVIIKEYWNKATGEHKEWVELTFDQLKDFAREIRNEALCEGIAEAMDICPEETCGCDAFKMRLRLIDLMTIAQFSKG